MINNSVFETLYHQFVFFSFLFQHNNTHKTISIKNVFQFVVDELVWSTQSPDLN